MSLAESSNLDGHPLAKLPAEDLELIVQLVLRSGSLKDLAEAYGVSYPTIRLRLDRVIERLKAAVEGKKRDPVRELLAELVERGEMTVGAARKVGEVVKANRQMGQSGKEGK
jgi:hypothetical protein